MNSSESQMTNEEAALVSVGDSRKMALRNAIAFWSDATTNTISSRRRDIQRDKQKVVLSFFEHAGKPLNLINPLDVKTWQMDLEGRGLAHTTVYYRLCHLSSFYTWAQRHPAIGQFITSNPVRLSHPKAPKPYQTESVKALTDTELKALLSVVRKKAEAGDLIGKRDFALLLFYAATGMRRAEVIGLRGRDIELHEEGLILRSTVKGGDYVARELRDPRVRQGLIDYLDAAKRTDVVGKDSPLWTRHDFAGNPGASLTSHAFVQNLKRYAKQAGIENFHLHQLRHTFARMVAEDSGSIAETQDALGHRHIATTKVYVQRIAVRRDKYSERILNLLDKDR